MSTQSKHTYRTFVVDDEPMVCRILTKRLSQDERLQVEAFPRGEAALEAFDPAPDFVILDYYMGENNMNGKEVLMKIKEQAPQTKVLMLSSQEKIGVAVETLKKGATDYVIKNQFFPVQVEQSLQKILDYNELQLELSELKSQHKQERTRVWAVIGVVAVLAVAIFSMF
ncbi:MAG: response regulator [Bacteroidota bacterium]